jgi:hypothetical protein
VTVLMAARLDVVLPRSPRCCEANHQVQAGYEGCEGGEGGAVCSSLLLRACRLEVAREPCAYCSLSLIPGPMAGLIGVVVVEIHPPGAQTSCPARSNHLCISSWSTRYLLQRFLSLVYLVAGNQLYPSWLL